MAKVEGGRFAGVEQRTKKTRDLPDLSICHACGLRFPSSNNSKIGDLRALRSEWRLVLLCRPCFRSLHIGTACSYCFSEFPAKSAESDGGDGILSCRHCSHRVHHTCAPTLLDPTSFLCIDCCTFSKCRFGKPNGVLEDMVTVAGTKIKKREGASASILKQRALRKAVKAVAMPDGKASNPEKSQVLIDEGLMFMNSDIPWYFGQNEGIDSSELVKFRICSERRHNFLSMGDTRMKDERESASNDVNEGEQVVRTNEPIVSSESSAVEGGDHFGIQEDRKYSAPDRYLKKYHRRRGQIGKEIENEKEGHSFPSRYLTDASCHPFISIKGNTSTGLCSSRRGCAIRTKDEGESSSSNVKKIELPEKSNENAILSVSFTVERDYFPLQETGRCARCNGYMRTYSRRKLKFKKIRATI